MLTESLKDTIERIVSYFERVIKAEMLEGKRVLIVAHGNSLRALVKYLEGLSEKEIVEVNIPTGIPLVYEFNDGFKVTNKYYLGDESVIAKKWMRLQIRVNPLRNLNPYSKVIIVCIYLLSIIFHQVLSEHIEY